MRAQIQNPFTYPLMLLQKVSIHLNSSKWSFILCLYLPLMRKIRLTCFIVCLLAACCSSLFAQEQPSAAELKKRLDAASTAQERYAIGYELASLLTKAREESAAIYAEQTYNEAKRQAKKPLMADAARLTAEAYEATRRFGKAEYWWKVTTTDAMAASDADLILRAVDKRSKMAIRDRNYQRATTIYEEALDYFTKDGNNIGNLRARVEAESAKLEAAQKALERQRAELAEELEILKEEQSILEEENDQLLTSQAQKTKELKAKQADLEEIQEAKKAAEERVAMTEIEVKSLSRSALEAKLILEEREKELRAVELLKTETELRAVQAEMASAQSVTMRNYALGMGAGLLLLSLLLYSRFVSKKRSAKALSESNTQLEAARERSDELLLNILPAGIAEELKTAGVAKARKFEGVTILFSDFVNFTRISEQLGPEQLVKELDVCFRAFDEIVNDYQGDVEKIKTIGDAYMAASGLDERQSIPTNLLKVAIRMQAFLQQRAVIQQKQGLPFFEARIGLHTGPAVAGVVGLKKFAYDVWGDTVNTASRVESQCEPGKINISETTFKLVKYQFHCEYRGKVQAKNKGYLDMYYVVGEQ